jgi:hypothetical protein
MDQIALLASDLYDMREEHAAQTLRSLLMRTAVRIKRTGWNALLPNRSTAPAWKLGEAGYPRV